MHSLSPKLKVFSQIKLLYWKGIQYAALCAWAHLFIWAQTALFSEAFGQDTHKHAAGEKTVSAAARNLASIELVEISYDLLNLCLNSIVLVANVIVVVGC